MRPSAQQNSEGAREIPVRERRLRLLAWRLPHDVAVSDRVPPACVQDRRRSEVPGRRRHARRAPIAISSSRWRRSRRPNEGWWPSYTAWQAFAVKVLVEGGRNQDSQPHAALRLSRSDAGVRAWPTCTTRIARAARRDRLAGADCRPAPPHGERDPARSRQRARRGADRSLPALVLELQRADQRRSCSTRWSRPSVADAPVRQLVRWMMAARKNGRWGNTQENALAMEALVAYYRKYESAVAGLPCRGHARRRGSRRARQFRGRSTTSKTQGECRWRRCSRAAPPGRRSR